jgi:hypothetical protein
MISFLAIQQTNIDKKIVNAPDSSYQIGIAIGSFLPFIILVLIAYFLYYRAKKRKI